MKMLFLLYLYMHQIFIKFLNNNVFLRKIRSNNMNFFLYFFLTMQQDKTVILIIIYIIELI